MSKLPETQQSLSRWLRQRERTALRQRQTSAFARSGTSVTAEGAQSLDGTLTVTPGTGFVSIDGSLGVHGTAAFDGTTTIGGDLVVAGTLSLPNAIIPDAALVSIVIPADCGDVLMGFALTTVPTVISAQTLTVPAGITSALVTATVRVEATNSTANLDALSTWLKIGSATAARQEDAVAGAGQHVYTISTSTKVLTGLTPGSTFDIAITAFTASASWAYNVLNGITIDGYVLWFR